jgi:hypothetical protein
MPGMGKRNARTGDLEEVVTVLEHNGVLCWRLRSGRLRANVVFELDELECEDSVVRWAPVLHAYCHDPVENRTNIVESQVSREYFAAHVVWEEG